MPLAKSCIFANAAGDLVVKPASKKVGTVINRVDAV